MKLIIIYGPPAAGKLTVAKELAERTGFVLLDNHRVTDYIPLIFPRTLPDFEDQRAQLGRKIRLLLFEAAAANNVNLITTFAPLYTGGDDFIRSIHRAVERAGGSVCLVQLLPSRETLDARVVGESRQGNKTQSVERLHELAAIHPAMFDTFPDSEHLVIDNTDLPAHKAAQMIAEHYDLV